nr:ATP-binding cassette domain-containing protein [Cytophagales bacterium]
MIEVSALKKKYKEATVLDIPALSIPKSECFGLVGNNGAGKTTFFRIILDLVRATEGHVFIDGEDVGQSENWKSKVGAFLDEHMLLSYLTPDEYFDALRKIYRLSKEDLSLHLERFRDLFNDEILGKKKYIRDLSKGNLKKVGIAAAMFGNPEAVLLDEPFENLDPSSQVRLKKLILQEKELNLVTFLISSHDLNHVMEICDRIVLLEKGVIIKDLQEKSSMAGELYAYFNVT